MWTFNVHIATAVSHLHEVCKIQRLDKIMETLQICPHFTINMVLHHLQLSVQPQSFLEWTFISFEQSLAEFCTTIEEHLHVAS
jgi:hypothetical protein